MDTIHFHPASPILRVADLKKSIEYYINILGFSIDWNYENVVASVCRGECHIMLAEGDQGNGKAYIYIGIDDTDKLFEEYQRHNANIRQKPTNFVWSYEMQVEDLDGNVIRFGSSSKENVPYGPWLDMNGKEWYPPDKILNDKR